MCAHISYWFCFFGKTLTDIAPTIPYHHANVIRDRDRKKSIMWSLSLKTS